MSATPEAFLLIAELAAKKFGAPLSGLFEVEIDEDWKARLNATRDEKEKIPPYTAALEWRGFPAGMIDPAGGVIAAGSAANEDSLCAALCKALGGGAL